MSITIAPRAGQAAHRQPGQPVPRQRPGQGQRADHASPACSTGRTGRSAPSAVPDWSLEAIYDRLEHNAPRIAIIGGSPDHPAHVMDPGTVRPRRAGDLAAGRRPVLASRVPVLCDGTAQSNMGMSYSLQSRNAIAEMIVNQMEAHSYHGAFVIQSCDKMPLAAVSALAHLDTLRRRRGEAPVFAAFAPAHVLKGGTIPPEVRAELEIAGGRVPGGGPRRDRRRPRRRDAATSSSARPTPPSRASSSARSSTASSRRSGTRRSRRARGQHLRRQGRHLRLQRHRATPRATSSPRMGLVHPAVELLTDPPTTAQVERGRRRPLQLWSTGRSAASPRSSCRTWATRSASTAPPAARPTC